MQDNQKGCVIMKGLKLPLGYRIRNHVRVIFRKKMCANCKTGADLLELDPKAPFCPKLYQLTNSRCKSYVKTFRN